MTTLGIDFTARRDTSGYAVNGDRIQRRGGELQESRPLEVQAALYAHFAQLPDDPEAFADFMGRFGPVSHDGHLDGEPVEHLVARRLWMARAIELSQSKPDDLLKLYAASTSQTAAISASWSAAFDRVGIAHGRNVGHLHVSAAANLTARLRPAMPDGRPALVLAPDTLWDAMQVQFFQTISSGAQLRSCDQCGTWFEVGGATGKRTMARFCTDSCRARWNNERAKGTGR